MNKIFSMLSLCLGINTAVSAQAKPLPYFTGFEDLMPVSDWQMIRKGATDPSYLWKIDNGTPYAGNLSLYHGYPVGGTAVTDDWFVSPEFSLVDGGKIDSIRHNFSGFGTPAVGDTVALYLLKGNPDPALASSKTLLYDFRDTKYTSDHTWKKTTNIAIPSTTGKAYIAIRYRTVSNWLDVRFDNVRISSNKPSSIGSVYKQGTDFTVSPIPAINTITINTAIAFQSMEIYDITGRMMQQQAFQPGVDLSTLPAGRYTLVLTDAQQQKGILSIIKQ
ncbi:MAG TPA: choice-of-anchor J domain-containing protein [Chitinophagaceae bacterium]|nr:choice-of-anchor J domain-containing protein [Chitinophagaceae bacterium]